MLMSGKENITEKGRAEMQKCNVEGNRCSTIEPPREAIHWILDLGGCKEGWIAFG